MSLENAYGLPTYNNGSGIARAGLYDWFSSNPNATIWNFNIRSGARWSDGIPINSSDITFTYQLSGNFLLNSPYDFLNLSSFITNVQSLNSSDTEFTLNKTVADFGNILSNQYYFAPLPEHIWQNMNTNDTNFGQDVTSGPYYHLAYDGGNNLTLRENPYYWNPVGIPQIDITFVNALNQTSNLLLNSQTDVTPLTPQAASILSPKIGLNVEPDRQILFLAYNVTIAPFNSTIFRQALAYSINTSAISQEVYDGYATPGVEGEGTIPPSATEWHNASDIQYNYNLTKAKSSLSTLGYTWNSAGNLVYPNGSEVNLQVYTDYNQSGDSQAAQMVAEDLHTLGIQTTLENESLLMIENNYQDNISQQLTVVSTSTSVFGLGGVDIQPAWDTYYPWQIPQSMWLEPPSAEAEYLNYAGLVNSSTTSQQSAVRDIDYLNSEDLPMIVLAYPDDLWGYSLNSGLTGISGNSSLDMGSLYLNPYTFSEIGCSGSCGALPQSTITTVTTNSTASSSSQIGTLSSSSTTVAPPPSTTEYEVITIIVVIAIIVLGTILSRRKKPPPPPVPIGPTS
jgi:ABC-type transport system substrate-binding protein